MAIITETKTFHPVGWDSAHSVFDENTNTSTFTRFVGDTDGATSSSSYGQVYLTKGSQAETALWIKFDFSSIPKNATITSINGKAKIYGSGGSNQVQTKNIGAYINGTTLKGSTSSYTTSTTVFDLSLGSGWSRTDLDSVEWKVYAQRGTSSVNSNYYARIYGMDITITYEYEEVVTKGKIFVNVNNTLKQVKKVFVKVNGVYKPVKKIINNGKEIIL